MIIAGIVDSVVDSAQRGSGHEGASASAGIVASRGPSCLVLVAPYRPCQCPHVLTLGWFEASKYWEDRENLALLLACRVPPRTPCWSVFCGLP